MDKHEQELLEKLINREELTEDEVRYLVYDYEHKTIKGDDRRWSRSNETIAEVGGRLWSVDWEEGLTENQDNEFEEQVAVEVIEKTRMVEEKYYEYVK